MSRQRGIRLASRLRQAVAREALRCRGSSVEGAMGGATGGSMGGGAAASPHPQQLSHRLASGFAASSSGRGVQQLAGSSALLLQQRLSLRAKLEHAYGYVSWAVRPGPDARIAIINSLNTLGSQWQRMLSVALYELGRQTCQRLAECLGMDSSFEATATVQRSKAVLDVADLEPRTLAQYLLAALDALQTCLRVGFLFALFAPVLLASPVALQYAWTRARWMRWFRFSLECAGPAFIKWGQWAASRVDLFPKDMCEQLEHLQSSAPAHSFGYTKSVIERSLGMPIHELFDSFEEEALASGSIGQVHRATLGSRVAAHSSFPVGQKVVVKVKHAGVDDAIRRDFAVMMAIADLTSRVPALEHLHLKDNLHQFAAPLREQVDLSYEASNLFRFNFNFRGCGNVCFPVPVYPLVMPDVLVETYEQGEPISKYVASPGHELNQAIARIGCRTYLKMLLVDNYLHSDLHPGNILVRTAPDTESRPLVMAGQWMQTVARTLGLSLPGLQDFGKAPGELQIVLLDVGMATGLLEEDKDLMLQLFDGCTHMDGWSMADATLRFSPQQTCTDPDAFRREVGAEVNKFKDWEASGLDKTSDALLSLLDLIRQHKVSIPGHICAVLVTALVLESWSGELDAEHSVSGHLRDTIGKRSLPWRERMPTSVDLVMLGDDVVQV
eukprot:jgi/Tetstr1/460401/TSEL_000079.t2